MARPGRRGAGGRGQATPDYEGTATLHVLVANGGFDATGATSFATVSQVLPNPGTYSLGAAWSQTLEGDGVHFDIGWSG